MSNRLLPYDTIIKAHEGDPIAIQAVLDRYAGYIRYFSKMNGYYNSDMEDYIRTKLIESLCRYWYVGKGIILFSIRQRAKRSFRNALLSGKTEPPEKFLPESPSFLLFAVL